MGSGMVLVRSVEVVECDQAEVRVTVRDPLSHGWRAEWVQGDVFCTADGRRVCLGMSPMVREVLGLPLGCFQKMSADLSRAHAVLARVRRLSLWERLRVLFGADPVTVAGAKGSV